MSSSNGRDFLSASHSRILAALIGLLVLAVVLIGTATAVGVLGMPQVAAIETDLVGANRTTTVVESALTVTNPNPFPITLQRADVTYTVYMNGIPVGDGEEPSVSLPSGNSTVQVRTGLQNDRIVDWWRSHIRRGERTNLTVSATLRSARFDESLSRRVADRTVRTDIISAFETNDTIPVNASREFVSDPVLYVNETNARWGNVTRNRTVVHTKLRVYNPKSFAIPVTTVRYDVGMNGVAVANGSTENLTAIPAKSHRNVTARVVIDNSKLDEWWVTHVERNQTTTVRVDYAVGLDLSAYGGGNRTVSPEPINRTFHTDVFGDRGSSGTITFS